MEKKNMLSTVTVMKEGAKRLCPQVGCGLPGEAGGLALYFSEKDYVCSYLVLGTGLILFLLHQGASTPF